MTESVTLPLPVPLVCEPAEVKTWAKIDDELDDDELELIVAAVDDFVRGIRAAERARGAALWPPAIGLGARMLSARLLRRKDTPDGVATFTNDGAVYVQRNDPDVAFLLGLGAYSEPAVG